MAQRCLMVAALVCMGQAATLSLAGPRASWALPNPPAVVLSGEFIQQANITPVDFDGDGDKELVIGGQDGMLYVVAYNGSSWSAVWSRQTAQDLNAAGAPTSGCVTSKSDIRSSAAVADLDNDGRLEIVVTTGGDPAQHRNGGVLVYRHIANWSFSVVPGWPQPKIDQVGLGAGSSNPDGCWDGIWSSPAVGDLDGDGDQEVIALGFDRRIHAWHHNGVYVSGWPIYRNNGDALLRGGWSSPALGDIDGDGLPEVVVGTDSPPWGGEGTTPDYSKSTVWAINGDSTNVPGWPVVTDQLIQSSPALGDIDGDGQLEVVVGTGVAIAGAGYKVYAWKGNGAPVAGWPKATSGYMPASPALGDLDGDGDLEIVIGCGYGGSACRSLYAWHGNGAPVFAPVTPAGAPNDLPYPPVLADYDGDGAVEILVISYGATGISIVEANGATYSDPALATLIPLSSAPIVDDLDGDGHLEIAVGAMNPTATNGAIYIWDVAGAADDALPWRMFHHDTQRTGNVHFDRTPPSNPQISSSTHTPGSWSKQNVVQVAWTGAQDRETGIARYHYVWDTSASTTVGQGAPWVDGDTSTLASGPLADGPSWYFHIRAMNGGGLLAANTVHYGPFKIDATVPRSQARAPSCAVNAVSVTWNGIDGGSGIASYDIQVRAGSGNWTTWRSATTTLSGVYTAATGQVYTFRSIARDRAGNVEAPPTEGDAATWLTGYGFSGSVYTIAGEPVFGAQVTSSPAGAVVAMTDPRGAYLLCHQVSDVEAVVASRSGFAASEGMRGLTGTLMGIDLYLPPLDDVVVNGQFETGTLQGWTSASSGSGMLHVEQEAHTGQYAAELSGGGPAAWSATLSQTVLAPQGSWPAALSLIYRLDAENGVSAGVSVRCDGLTLNQSLPATTDWSHVAFEINGCSGKSTTLVLTLTGGSGDQGTLLADEISLGSAVAGAETRYLPAVIRTP